MKLNIDYIKSQVVAVDYAYSGTFTICTITTKAGTKLAGTSGCLDPANYDRAIGEKVAYDNAVNQLWQLEGYFFSKLGMATWANPEQGQMIALNLFEAFNAGKLRAVEGGAQ